MNYAKQFYNLDQFLGGYFHQDWVYVFDWKGKKPNFEDVVRYYRQEQHPDYLAKVINELQAFLELPLSEDQLKKILSREFYVAYSPHRFNITIRYWLERILDILEGKNDSGNTNISWKG